MYKLQVEFDFGSGPMISIDKVISVKLWERWELVSFCSVFVEGCLYKGDISYVGY